jgi:hypothetical protein
VSTEVWPAGAAPEMGRVVSGPAGGEVEERVTCFRFALFPQGGLGASNCVRQTRALYNEILPSLLVSLLKGAARLFFTARIDRAHSDRARSASKKDGLTAPSPALLAKKSHAIVPCSVRCIDWVT